MITISYLLYFSIHIPLALFSQTNFSNSYGEYVPRVVNGYAAKLGNAPYQIGFKVLTRQRKIYTTFCGGVILSQTKLLSAAHCFVKKANFCQKLVGVSGTVHSLLEKYAVAGHLKNTAYFYADNPNDGSQWRKLGKVTFPRTYKFPRDDIAVVYVRSPFTFNTFINYIPIATKFLDYHGRCLVSGYGRTSLYSSKSSDKLLLAVLDLIPMEECSRMHRRKMKKFVCTSGVISDVAKGDSGGPLVCTGTTDPNEEPGKGILIGIVSGHRYGVGSFFTRVSTYHKYIERGKSNIIYYKISLIILIQTIILLL